MVCGGSGEFFGEFLHVKVVKGIFRCRGPGKINGEVKSGMGRGVPS